MTVASVPRVVARRFALHRAAITAVLLVSFFFTFFHRMGMAVIVPDLESAFGLSAVGIGLLGSAYFYPYAISQLPIGVLLDTVGVRRIFSIFVAIGGGGSLLFAIAATGEQSIAGRLLVGLGVGAIYLASQKLFINWFPARQFATLCGLMNSVGNLGGLAASLPLAVAAATIGWRSSFAGVGLLLLGLAIVAFFIMRDHPAELGYDGCNPEGAPPVAAPTLRQQLKVMGTAGQAWLLAAALLPFIGTRFGLQGLWGGPYLNHVYGMSAAEVGVVLMVMNLSGVISSPILGMLSDRVFHSRRRFALGCLVLYILCWLPLVFTTDSIPRPLLYPLFMAHGSLAGAWIPVYAQAKEYYPAVKAGTVLAIINFAATFGGAVYQQAMGVVIDMFERTPTGYSVSAYSAAFLFCLVSAVFATTLIALSKEPA